MTVQVHGSYKYSIVDFARFFYVQAEIKKYCKK